MGDTGFDSPLDFTGKNADQGRGDAESDASSDVGLIVDDDDAGWAAIKTTWPMLSADARRAIVEFVDRELGTVGRADFETVASDRAE